MRVYLTVLRLVAFAAVTALGGCNADPAPPTIENAKTIWHHTAAQLGLGPSLELLDMKETDGQMAVMNEVKVYTLYYQATNKYLTPFGGRKAGDVVTYQSNYGFTRTEKGWLATDGELL